MPAKRRRTATQRQSVGRRRPVRAGLADLSGVAAASVAAGGLQPLSVVRYDATSQFLADAAYAKSTRGGYDRALSNFKIFVGLHQYSFNSVQDVDTALSSYYAWLYEQGYAPAAGTKTCAAITRHAGGRELDLPFSSMRLRGWTKLMPVIKRPPLTWGLTLCAAILCVHWGKVHVGVGYLVGFHGLLRISEIRGLRLSDIALPGDARFDGANRDIILRIRIAKTGVNQSVSITDPFIIKWLRIVIGGRDLLSDQPLFVMSEFEFRAGIRAASSFLGLKDHFTPHSLRHGGCTYLYAVKKMTPDAIMVRGRWAAQRSFTHYLQEHHSALIQLQLSPKAASLGRIIDRYPNWAFGVALHLSTITAGDVVTARREYVTVFG